MSTSIDLKEYSGETVCSYAPRHRDRGNGKQNHTQRAVLVGPTKTLRVQHGVGKRSTVKKCKSARDLPAWDPGDLNLIEGLFQAYKHVRALEYTNEQKSYHSARAE